MEVIKAISRPGLKKSFFSVDLPVGVLVMYVVQRIIAELRDLNNLGFCGSEI